MTRSAAAVVGLATLAVTVLASGACRKPADECQRMVDKSGAMFAELAKAAKREISEDDKAKVVAQCRQTLASGHRDPVLDCVLGATGDAAVRACYLKGDTGPAGRPKQPEARRELDKLAKHAKAYYLARGEFPRGEAPLTPATACCSQPDKQCAVPETVWSTVPAWAALEFRIDHTFAFQYSYQSDGVTFTAKAVGDVRCDGHPVTYLIEGSAPDGSPQVTSVDP